MLTRYISNTLRNQLSSRISLQSSPSLSSSSSSALYTIHSFKSSLVNKYHYSSGVDTNTTTITNITTTIEDEDQYKKSNNIVNTTTNPRGYWVDKINQKEFLEKMGKDKGFLDDTTTQIDSNYYEQWYQVQKIDFIEYKGRGLLLHYNDSVYQLLKSIYSDYQWLPWKFVNTPRNFWRDHQNQLDYLVWLGKKIGIENPRDWYRVTKSDFIENYGNSLLLLYGGSPAKVVMQVFNKKVDVEVEEQIEQVKQEVQGNNINNDDDTSIRNNDNIGNREGNQFQNYKYLIWRFKCLPRGSFKDMTILKDFIEFTKEYYRMEKKEDWYRLSWTQIRDIGGFSLIKKNGGIYRSLKLVYPDVDWEVSQFATPGKKASQRLLKIFLEKLFPEDDIHEDYRDVTQLRYQDSTGAGFQLDFYLPRLQLAFEYQGKQHFQDTRLFGDYKIYHERDIEKREVCRRKGIHIIDVPYWWDNHLDSLIGTIQQYNPSILQPNHSLKMYNPIPKTYQKIQTNKKTHTLFID